MGVLLITKQHHQKRIDGNKKRDAQVMISNRLSE